MVTKFQQYSERSLVALLAVLFLVPLTLTVLVSRVPEPPAWAAWLGHPWMLNTDLGGVQVKIKRLSCNARNVLNGKYQKSVADGFDLGFAGRECLIHLTNEGWFRVFHEPSNRLGPLALGRHDWIYETEYLEEYYLNRPSKEELEPLVDRIRRLQNVCRARGMAFVVLVTPSKAATYPEENPRALESRYDPRPRAYELMRDLFREKGILHVDGAAIAREKKVRNQSGVPLFPKGGIHWGAETVLAIGNVLLEEIREQGVHTEPMQASVEFTDVPSGDDKDVLALLNLAVPWRYPTTKLTIKPTAAPDHQRPSAVFVGGSFIWGLMEELNASRQFSEMDVFYYHTISKNCFADGESWTVREPVGKIDFTHEVFAADCLILEMNEEVAPSPNHLRTFVRQALAHRPHRSSPREPFRFETWLQVEWGQRMFFGTVHPRRVQPAALRGFSEHERAAIWTVEREAGIRLAVPDSENGLILRAKVSAFLHPAFRPKQRALIYANDEPVGEWSFSVSDNERLRQVFVPARLRDAAGRLVMRFEMDSVASPKELGFGKESRKLGLSFTEMRLWPAPRDFGGAEPAVDFMPCRWGKRISFRGDAMAPVDPSCLSGFSVAEAHSTWTAEPRASVRLLVPPSDGEVVLRAGVQAFLDPEKLPSREAKVFANDRQVGAWTFSGDQSLERETTIPRECIDGKGQLTLRFEIDGASGPGGRGLQFTSITLQPVVISP